MEFIIFSQHHVDPAIGVYIIDRYTYYALEFLEKVTPDSKKSMGEFLQVCPKRVCISTVGIRKDLYPKDPYKVPITNFFGSIRQTEIVRTRLNLTLPEEPEDTKEENSVDGDLVDYQLNLVEQFPGKLFQ